MHRISQRLLVVISGLFGILWWLAAQDSAVAAPAWQTAAPVPAGGDPVVLAAGDIAQCNVERDSLTAYLLETHEGTVLTLGDSTNLVGSPAEFRDCFAPTWGRQLDRIYPIPGNHDYGTQGAQGYYSYFGDKATPLEPGCTRDCKGYYSFDLGAWHIVALNSEVPSHAGTEQEQWLRADLAAHPAQCILAFWHRARISSSKNALNGPIGPWQALYDYGGDIVLSGHDHVYERFAPLNPALEYDPAHGIRQFIVGTGGHDHFEFRNIQPTSEVRNNETWGVLKLTLHSDSYDWEFLPIDGQTFTDKGSAPCVTPKNQPFYSTPEQASAPATTLISTAAVVAEVAAGGEAYTIQAGDTLGTIGARFGLEWSVLAAANGLDAYSILEIGQVIRVPGANETVAPLVTSEFETTLAGRAPVTNSAPVVVATLAATASLSSQSTGSKYTVQAGDTLFGLALRFGVAQQVLMDANSLGDGDFLQIGQQLVIPGKTGSSLAAQSPTPAPTASVTKTVPTVSSAAPAATPAPVASTPGSAKYHTVASGDTIISIALTYNKDWEALLELNGLKPDTILQIGQRVRID